MKKFIFTFISLFLFISPVYANNVYYVSNVTDALNSMVDIYKDGKEIGDYSLIPINDSVNMTEIFNSILDKYASPLDKRIYKYDEYATIHKEKFYASLSDNIITVNNYNKVITDKEKKEAEKLADKFIDKYKDLDDYNKIYTIYAYLSHTVKYPNNDAYYNYVDAYISIFDTLITKIGDCVGMSIAFQYLAENMGIESYIVDHVESINPETREYISSHSYNIVKLDGNWYIVDVHQNDDLSGLLIGMKDSYSSDNYNDISISLIDYNRPDKKPEIDYNLSVIKEEKIINNEWLVFALILIIITLIICISVKRK